MDIAQTLIWAGIGLILAEVIIPGVYFPAIGIAVLIYGVFLIYYPTLALPAALTSGIITILLLYTIVYAVGNKVKVGAEKYIGKIITLDKDSNRIFLEGNNWTIISKSEEIHKGDKVKIVGIEGVHLIVEKVNE